MEAAFNPISPMLPFGPICRLSYCAPVLKATIVSIACVETPPGDEYFHFKTAIEIAKNAMKPSTRQPNPISGTSEP